MSSEGMARGPVPSLAGRTDALNGQAKVSTGSGLFDGMFDMKRRRSRRASPILLVSPNVLINCPPLHSARPHPTLHATDLTIPAKPFRTVVTTAPKDERTGATSDDKESPRKKARLSGPSPTSTRPRPSAKAETKPPPISNARKTFHLPLPPPMTHLAYSYAAPTLLSKSHDPKYFVAFFPRIGNKEAERAAGRRVPGRGRAPHSDEAGMGRPDDSKPQDLEETEYSITDEQHDLGGMLVLYTRPQSYHIPPTSITLTPLPGSLPSASTVPTPLPPSTTYTCRFQIHSWYDVEAGGVIGVTWLFPPRKWVAVREEEKGEEGEVETATGAQSGMGGDVKDEGQGEAEDMSGLGVTIDMDVDLDATGIAQDQATTAGGALPNGGNVAKPTIWKSPRLERLPAFGPPPVNTYATLSGNGEPGYPARSNASENAPTFMVMLSNHRVVLLYTSNKMTGGLARSTSKKMPQFGSSFAPLSQLVCGVQTPSLSVEGQVNQISTDPTTYIKAQESCITIRASDDRIWIAYRSTRRKRTISDSLVSAKTDSKGSQILDEVRRQSMYSDEPSPDVPLALSARIPQTAQFLTQMAAANGVGLGLNVPAIGDGLTSIAGAGLGVEDVQARAQLQGMLQGLGATAPLDQTPLASTEWREMLVEDDDAGMDEVEEGYVHIVEVKVSFLEAAVSLQVRPAPRVSIPAPEPGHLSRLDSLTFTELPVEEVVPDSISDGTVIIHTADGKRAEDINPYSPDRPLGLLLLSQQYDTQAGSGLTKLEQHRLVQTEIKLAPAFAGMTATAPDSAQSLAEATRVEWQSVSKVEKLFSDEWLELVRTGPLTATRPVFVMRTALRLPRHAHLSALDATSLDLTDVYKLRTAEASGAAVCTDEDLIAARDSDRSVALLLASGKVSDQREWVERVAVCLMQKSNPAEFLHLMPRLVSDLDPAATTKLVWQVLEDQNFGLDAKPDRPAYLLPLIRLHAQCCRAKGDYIYRLSMTYLHLLATDLAYSSSMRSVPKRPQAQPPANGSAATPQRLEYMRVFELDSIWLLVAHTDWILDVFRAFLREAVLYATADRSLLQQDPLRYYRDYPNLSMLFSQACRNVIRRIGSQAYAFVAFCNTLRAAAAPHPLSSSTMPRDPSASHAASVVMRGRIDDSGLRLECMIRALSDIQELLRDQQAPTGESGALATPPALPYDFSVPAEKLHLFPRIVARLTNDANLVRSQSALLTRTPISGGDIVGAEERDIITKERLPGKMLFSSDGSPLMEFRQCNRCGGRSVLYTSQETGMSGNSLPGLPPRKHGYVARSCWDREARKYIATCICGGGWVNLA